MKRLYCFILTIFCFYSSFSQTLSKEKAIQDFRIFETALKEAHPGIYRYETVSAFDSLLRQTEDAIQDSITQEQFYRLLSPVIARLHCGHTKFHPENSMDESHLYHYYFGLDHLFPFKLYFQGKKAYVINTFGPEAKFNFGTELLSIDHQSIESLMDFFFQNIVADGNVQSSKYLELSTFFSAYYANLIDAPDEFYLELKDSSGQQFSLTVPSVTINEIRNFENQLNPASEPTFRLSFPKEHVALMEIKAFYPLHKEDDFKEFLKSSFEEIHRNNVNRLIIDLRNNEGGEDRWGALLFSYLAKHPFEYYEALRVTSKKYSFKKYVRLPVLYPFYKLLLHKDANGGYLWTSHKNLDLQYPQKEAFTGEVVVLVNGFSFSVTSEFAAVARSQGRIRLAGQETGGAYGGNNSGTFAIVTLPNSRLCIGIPIVGYYMSLADLQPYDRGVLPDEEMIPTVQEILHGEDLLLERVLKD